MNSYRTYYGIYFCVTSHLLQLDHHFHIPNQGNDVRIGSQTNQTRQHFNSPKQSIKLTIGVINTPHLPCPPSSKCLLQLNKRSYKFSPLCCLAANARPISRTSAWSAFSERRSTAPPPSVDASSLVMSSWYRRLASRQNKTKPYALIL